MPRRCHPLAAACVTCAVTFALVLVLPAREASAARPRRPGTALVTSIRTAAGDAGTSIVTIQAEGRLPVPAVGVLEGPPRIFLDFPGTALGPVAGPAPGEERAEGSVAGPVRGVRVSRYRRRPPVVRVVIDLERPAAHAIDLSGRAAGRIVVSIGAGLPSTPAARRAAVVAATPGRPRDAERYFGRVSPILARLHILRRGVASVATGPVSIPADVDAAASELDELGRSLAALKAPASVATPHDLLLRFCAIGARAIRMRTAFSSPGDPASVQNAASAAAGALIMLDRASQDLGYTAPQ